MSSPIRHTFSILFATLVLASVIDLRAEESPAKPAGPPEEIKALVDKIGKWDGTTPQAALEGPYEDRLQQQIPFGQRSYYLTPWRSYMDTWPAEKFLNCLGVGGNGVNAKEVDAVAQILAENQIRHVRVEIGWGSFKFDNPGEPQGNGGQWPVVLKTYHDHGIRPLILLNGNSGAPCPFKEIQVALKADTEPGQSEIIVDNVKQIVEGYTGLRGQAYQIGFPLILKADAATGKCTLSAPLLKPIKAGALKLCILKFHPFGGAVLEDGKPNPKGQETVDGWMQYVAGVCKLAKDALGTNGAADAGFDLEVWNEYTFGSQFLDEKNYYVPARKFKEKISYTNHGRTVQGSESVLQRTVDFINDTANACPGVNVINGFANQRPWDSGSDQWPGQAGFSRHYYCGLRTEGIFGGLDGFLYPGNEKENKATVLNALGLPEPKDATPFTPVLKLSLPETWHLGYKTELMTREVQPFPGPMNGHGRYTHGGDGRYAQVWMTEFNADRGPWTTELKAKLGDQKDDPKLLDLLHAIAAKITLRTFVFQSHKGLSTITMYNVKEGDAALAVTPSVFFKELKAAEYKLTDAVHKLAGPQLEVLGRVAERFRKDGKKIDAPRKLEVSALVEHEPRLVFRGDGTREHPDRFNRDDFACLPFQMDESTFQVGYYVVSRNAVHSWSPEKGILDPQRYIMPDQTFDLTLANIRGINATASAWDPYTNQDTPLKVLDAKENSLTLQLTTTDYPRFIRIQEEKAGPQILEPKLTTQPDGKVLLSFKTNLPCKPMVSAGAIPTRDKIGKAELPEGTEHRWALNALPEDAGVRIRLNVNGLTATWPMWPHDTAGMLKWSKREKNDKSVSIGQLYIPALPPGSKVDSYTAPFKGSSRTLANLEGPETKVELTLKEVSDSSGGITELLPETSVLDRLEVTRTTWSGQPAWKADCTLDPIAHPGLLFPRQTHYIIPIKTGLLRFSVLSDEKGFSKNQETIKKLVESFKFETAGK